MYTCLYFQCLYHRKSYTILCEFAIVIAGMTFFLYQNAMQNGYTVHCIDIERSFLYTGNHTVFYRSPIDLITFKSAKQNTNSTLFPELSVQSVKR